MELSFDIRGNLKSAHEILELDASEFELQFVAAFDQDSTRLAIYENYEKYLLDIRTLLEHNFFQWIDGSFVTTKKILETLMLLASLIIRIMKQLKRFWIKDFLHEMPENSIK